MQPPIEASKRFVLGYSIFRLIVLSFGLAVAVNIVFIEGYSRFFLPPDANEGNTESFIWLFAFFGAFIFWPAAAFALWIVKRFWP